MKKSVNQTLLENM